MLPLIFSAFMQSWIYFLIFYAITDLCFTLQDIASTNNSVRVQAPKVSNVIRLTSFVSPCLSFIPM